jgi:hypothetical protein
VRLPRLPDLKRRRYVGAHRSATAEAAPAVQPVPLTPEPVAQVVLCFRDGTAAALDPESPMARALRAAASHMRARTP